MNSKKFISKDYSNFAALRVLDRLHVLEIKDKKGSIPNFPQNSKTVFSYYSQSVVSILLGWLSAYIFATTGILGVIIPSPTPLGKFDYLLQSHDLLVNLVVIATIFVGQFLWVAIKVWFRSNLDTTLRFGFGMLTLVMLALLVVLHLRFAFVSNPLEGLYLSSPEEFSFFWITLSIVCFPGWNPIDWKGFFRLFWN